MASRQSAFDATLRETTVVAIERLCQLNQRRYPRRHGPGGEPATPAPQDQDLSDLIISGALGNIA
jgi:hypothetical protein